MAHDARGNTKAQPDALDSLIEERRKKLPEADRPPKQEGRWGVALSGGGIRSSIFCYGLITALAKAKVFSRFDLMSTVSGGGYIGSMVGRLAQNAPTVEAFQDELGAHGATSHHRSWLRANSRYLTPRGSRDRLFGIVTFLRNLAGVHLELGFLAILLACVLGFIDILAWYGMDQMIKANPSLPFGLTPLQLWESVSKWPTLWLALPVPAIWAIGAATWYWYMPTSGRENVKVDIASHEVTRQLALAVQTGIAFVLLGSIDWIAWHLAKQPAYLFPLGAFFAAILSGLRLVLPSLQQNGSSSELLRQRLPMLLDLAGRFGLLVLVIFWTSLVHAFATSQVWDPDRNQVDFVGAAWALAVITAIALGWIALSGRNLEFLNRSSLHNFYRSRLSRAYLGAANPQRKSGSKVTEVHTKDDVPLNEYTPHLNGGPVHIINVCINQTYQREGLYNIDRQGDLMSLVGPGLFKVQGRQWLPLEADTLSTLGTWMAVSGAAAAPGMGSLTRPGIASILTTLGVRLGYWWRTGHKDPQWSSILVPKYKGLCSELLAKFAGTVSNTQYLTDGGHSENTAAYPLLEARCELIVLADCGADPDYKFQDLENLIRRARIDLNVDIRFIEPPIGSSVLFGSLDDLASPTKPACLALARIEYPDNPPGVLVLVKPNLTPGLPEDIYNYSRDCQDFPQESTADQFFDEAQWESYFSLGLHLGRGLDGNRLRSLTAVVRSDEWVDARAKKPLGHTSVATVTGIPDATPADREATDDKSRRPLRIPAKSAAAAGLGLGVIFSSASALWVAFQNVQGDDSAGSEQLLKPLYDTYGSLPVSTNEGQLNDSVGQMAAQLLTTWRTLRAHDQQDLFLNNPEALDMLRKTYGLCARMSDKLAVCNTLLKTFQCPSKPTASMVAQNDGYWAREEPAEFARMYERKSETYCDPDEPDGASLQVVATTLAQETLEPPPAVAPAPAPAPESTASATDVSPNVALDQQVAIPSPTEADQGAGEELACSGITIFIQIYNPNGRDNVRALRSLWRANGASVPPIEDVSASARSQGRSAPTPYGRPTVIYHQQDAKACAEALPGLAFQPEQSWDVVALNERFKKFTGTIEVWLPPTAVAEGFAQWASKFGYCYQEYNPLAQPQARYGVHCHPSLAACEEARGPNPKRKQSACKETVLNPNGASMLPLSGWAGSRYNLSETMFGPPFAPIQNDLH